MTSSRPAATPATSSPATTAASSTVTCGPSPAIAADGSLHVDHALRSASAVLPARYVAADVVLGYATTIAGAQGRTVDRGHVVVTPRTTSASLYVGMSRGRDANHAHVVCDSHDHTEFELGDLTGEQAFAAATQREPDGQLSAHTVRQRWDDGRRRPHHRPSRRPPPPPDHRLVDQTSTVPPARHADRDRRPTPPDPRGPPRAPQRRQLRRRHPRRSLLDQLAQPRRRRPLRRTAAPGGASRQPRHRPAAPPAAHRSPRALVLPGPLSSVENRGTYRQRMHDCRDPTGLAPRYIATKCRPKRDQQNDIDVCEM